MANETVLRRYEGNPIIVPAQVPRANSIFNSAVIPFGDGYVGVFRVDEICRTMSLHVGGAAMGWSGISRPTASTWYATIRRSQPTEWATTRGSPRSMAPTT